MKEHKFLFLAIGVILLPVLVAGVYVLTKKITGLTPDDILRFTGGNVLLEIGIILLVYAAKSVLFFIPVAFIYILTGNLFPPVYSIFLNLLGICVTLTLTFFLGKLLGKNKVGKLVNRSEKVKKFMEQTEKNNLRLFLLRLSGIFPVELISLVCGCTGYRYWGFLFFSLVAMAPSLIPFSIMGDALKNPFSKEFLIPFGIAVLLMIVSLVVYKIKNKEG